MRLLALLGGDSTSGGVSMDGDAGVLAELMSVTLAGDKAFNIVTP